MGQLFRSRLQLEILKGCWAPDLLGGAENPHLPRQAGPPAASGAPAAPSAAAGGEYQYPAEPGWVTGLTGEEAENLLDWLESHGCTGREVSCPEGTDFAVRCVCPPGFRLGRDERGRVRLLKV